MRPSLFLLSVATGIRIMYCENDCLRDYQQEMKLRLFEEWELHRSVMVQMPTGTGKTHLLAAIVREFLCGSGSRVWIVAHRRELVEQIEETVSRYGMGREDGSVRVMSIQWLSRNRKDMYEEPDLIVIDEALERILFRGDDPLGKPVKIHNNIYRVAGVYRGDAQQRNSMGYIPLTTGQLIFKANDPVVDNAIITVHGLDTDAQMEAFEQRIRKRLAAEHHYDPEDQSALWIRNTMEQYKSMMIVFGGINLFVWIIGLGTLLAGIVSVSNIMLVTVTERTSEFGIRKALGAKPVSIIRLILTESVMITAMFGYIGMVLGVAVMEAVNYVINQTPAQTGNFGGSIFLNPTLDLGVAVSATVVLVIAGLIAGYIPAYRAAQLKTIDALRYNK